MTQQKMGQREASLVRQLQLLLLLSTHSSRARGVPIEEVVESLAPWIPQLDAPHPVALYRSLNDPELPADVREAAAARRHNVHETVSDSAAALRSFGYDVRKNEVRLPNGGTTTRYQLVESPWLPITIPAADLPLVLDLVAEARLRASGDVPEAARRFSEACSRRVLVDVAEAGRVIPLSPVVVVLDDQGRWKGVGITTDSGKPLTVGLNGSWEVTLRDDPADPVCDVDVRRLMHPLTWGAHSARFAVEVDETARSRAGDLLGPAVSVLHRLDGGRARLELDVSDEDLLLARLASLGTAVHTDDDLAGRVRAHVISLTEPCAWTKADESHLPSEPTTAAQHDEAGLVPVGMVLPRVTMSSSGPARVAAITAALALLAGRNEWPASELADRIGVDDVGKLDQLLTTYRAIESDLADRFPERSTWHVPLRLRYDARGRLESVAIEPDPEAGLNEGPESLGRYRVSRRELLAAVLAARERLDRGLDESQAAVYLRLIDSGLDALGVFAAATEVLYDTGSVVEQAGEDLIALALRRVHETGFATGELVAPVHVRDRNAPAPPVAELQPRLVDDGDLPPGNVLLVHYLNPWTLAVSTRTLLPVARRRMLGQTVLDAVDLELRTAGGPGYPYTRTFVERSLESVELTEEMLRLTADELAHAKAEGIRTTLVTLAVNPGNRVLVRHLKQGWGADLTLRQGRLLAHVEVRQPARERLVDLLLQFPRDLRVEEPSTLTTAGVDRVAALLANPFWPRAADRGA